MMQNQLSRLSYRDSLKAVEADIQHANTLAAAIPRAYGGACLQLKLSYSPLAPSFFFLLQWMDFACAYSLPSYLNLLHILICKVYVDGKTNTSSCERKASLTQFYAVIYPSLQQLEGELTEQEDIRLNGRYLDLFRRRAEERRKVAERDPDREDECGICMEVCTRIVLSNCNHAMCISCYRDWKTRSQSCPFCRGSLKRVNSKELWVLISNGDVVDTATVAKENLNHFYAYIENLPAITPDTLFVVYYDYVI